jgi:hypothetical protein
VDGEEGIYRTNSITVYAEEKLTRHILSRVLPNHRFYDMCCDLC